MDNPQYKHDDGGTFLGRFSFISPHSNLPFDVDLYYFDDNGIGEPTIMSRWGNHPAENSTGLAFGWTGLSPDMTEARRRAEAMGLDVRRDEYHTHNMPQRGEIVFYQGQPHTFSGIAHPKYQGVGVMLRPGYPQSPDHNPRQILIAPFNQVTDLDNNEIHWYEPITT